MAELSIFNRTTQKTMEIIKLVQDEANIDDQHKAFQALRITLNTLRDRIPPDEAADLGAQLPNLLAGFYYEGWKPSTTPNKDRRKEDFLNRVREYLNEADPQLDAEHCVRCVFTVLRDIISKGEIEDILKTLPSELRDLWSTPKVNQ